MVFPKCVVVWSMQTVMYDMAILYRGVQKATSTSLKGGT